MSGWQDFIGKNGAAAAAATAEPPKAPADIPNTEEDAFAPQPDPADYKAFILQRGRTRPALFIDLRQFDERSGTLTGTLLSYPQLVSVDYFDGHSIELNFGFRRFRIEGDGLSELVSRLQSGTVLAIQQFSDKVWKSGPRGGPLVRRIIETTATDTPPSSHR